MRIAKIGVDTESSKSSQILARQDKVDTSKGYVQMEDESTEFQIIQGQNQIEMQNRAKQSLDDTPAENHNTKFNDGHALVGTDI